MFTRSKTGEEKYNEDCFLIGENFIVVTDGTTTKGEVLLKESDGVFVSRFVCNSMKNVPLDKEPIEILETINELLAKELNIKNRQGVFASCSLLIFNAVRNEIISYGDCRYKVNKVEYGFEKKIDKELSKIRSDIVKQELASGKTIDDVKENDVGRKAIEQALTKSVEYANQNGEYGYPVLNGKGVLKELMSTVKVKKGDMVILSTDGYPRLYSTLKKTEKYLRKALKKDPLCIGGYMSTKGIMGSNVSFDDRTYIRVKI